MISFTYADNSESINRALESFQDALADNTPALREMADDFREMIAAQFASEGRAAGTPWAPRMGAVRQLADGRPGQAQGLPLLVRTGALRDSLVEPYAAGHVEGIDAQSLTIGSRLPYALFHQLGTRRMSPRPIIVLSDERSQRWAEFVRSAIEERTLALGPKALGATKL